MVTADSSIVLVGCGRMGLALWRMWRDANRHITVVEHDEARRTELAHYQAMTLLPAMPHTIDAAVTVMAIKPQQMTAWLHEYGMRLSSSVLVSIAAGISLSSLSPYGCAAVRAMPHLPLTVRRGITALCGDDRIGKSQRAMIDQLFGMGGHTLWLDNDDDMDRATAVSGSGPAYVCYFMEQWIEAARNLGFSSDEAYRLVEQTMMGTLMLLKEEHEPSLESLRALRASVTSPQGTTAAAMGVLQKHDSVMGEALAAAYRRAQELKQAQ